MRKFIQRALNKLSKLDKQQIHALIYDLARANEQMEVVLESLTDGVLVTDQDNHIILINKAAERLIPIRMQDENIIWEVIDDRDIANFVQQTIESEELVRDKEFTLQGPSRILSLSILPLIKKGRVGGNLIHVDDISEKRLRENRLRRAENLASLTNLTAGVAHEIKNPLGSISIHIQLMERILTEHDGMPELQKHLDIVSEEVIRLNRIVMDFLFAVRPIGINLEESDMNALLHEIMEFLQYELKEEGIELVEDYQIDIPRILLDEKFMKQAVLNIVKNAISAMPDGGTLTLRTCFYDSEVQLNISDTGTGMTEELMQKIFEPYFSTREDGSGIGLTVVYKIIKEHRADISVTSTKGRGSTFLIKFPTMPDQRNLIASRVLPMERV